MGTPEIIDPKKIAGAKKIRVLSVLPPSVILYAAAAMENGADKYGPYNFREEGKTTEASIYIDAAMRHLFAWWDGEDIAPDSGKPHLGHAIASLFAGHGLYGELESRHARR